MLGLNQFTMVECSKCFRAWSIKPLENPSSLSIKTKCEYCGHEFSFLEGIVQNLVSANTFSEYSFTSNIMLHDVAEVTVGYPFVVSLPREVPVINKIFLTCVENFADVTPVIQDARTFRILSSAVPNGILVGGKLKVSWGLWGRSEWGTLPVWRRLLVQAKEELISQKYNLALLTSEIAFESFIDSILGKLLSAKSVPKEASNVVLESVNIKNKVHKLLLYLDGITFKKSGEINKEWESVVNRRNDIAHGEIAEISMDEARSAFKTIVRAIFYILQETSVQL